MTDTRAFLTLSPRLQRPTRPRATDWVGSPLPTVALPRHVMWSDLRCRPTRSPSGSGRTSRRRRPGLGSHSVQFAPDAPTVPAHGPSHRDRSRKRPGTVTSCPPVEQVRPGLWSIPVPIPANPLRYVLVYAFELDSGVALVDAGWNTDDAWTALDQRPDRRRRLHHRRPGRSRHPHPPRPLRPGRPGAGGVGGVDRSPSRRCDILRPATSTPTILLARHDEASWKMPGSPGKPARSHLRVDVS